MKSEIKELKKQVKQLTQNQEEVKNDLHQQELKFNKLRNMVGENQRDIKTNCIVISSVTKAVEKVKGDIDVINGKLEGIKNGQNKIEIRQDDIKSMLQQMLLQSSTKNEMEVEETKQMEENEAAPGKTQGMRKK